jgi:hypothetical protein
MRLKHQLQGTLLFALTVLLFGCPGGSSGDKEKVYGTAVEPSTYFSPTSPSGSTKSKAVQLAECMTEKGAVVYGSRGCSITVKQLGLFGDGRPYLEYVDCNDHRDLCSKNNIRYYPTWICKRRRMEGSYPLDALAVFTGCD